MVGQYTVTGLNGKLNLQLLSQFGSTHNSLSRSVPEIHWHVTRTFSKQATDKPHQSIAFLSYFQSVTFVADAKIDICRNDHQKGMGAER